MHPQSAFLRASCLMLALAFQLIPSGATARDAGPGKGQGATALAPLDVAHTFARLRRGDAIHTLLVVGMQDEAVSAVDLSTLAGLYSAEAFDVIARFSPAALDALAHVQPRRRYRIDALLDVGPRGIAHIAAGTNYRAHAEETGVDGTFLFPKISPASHPRAELAAPKDALMDYEVEVCARFDREVRSLDDFDASRKGFFLCGDFSDRASLMRNIDLRNILSGDGFADAKSGADRFPAGPFLVVPKDWRAFLAAITIETWVNGERRQQVRAGEMIKDLRTIVQETLEQAGTRTWSYQGSRIPMLARPAIGTESAVLTGTGEGVVFREPGPDVVRPLMQARDRAAQLAIIERYIGAEGAKRIYLQPGDRVRHAGNYLGSIDTRVVAANAARR